MTNRPRKYNLQTTHHVETVEAENTEANLSNKKQIYSNEKNCNIYSFETLKLKRQYQSIDLADNP